MSPQREDRARTHPPESTPLWTTMLVCRTRLLGARPAPSPDSTATHPSPRADPRDALDAMRHDHGRPGDRPREAAGRRNGRHPHRIHRSLGRFREPAFSNSPHPSPDVMTKDDSRGRTQGPRPCRRSTASAAPGARGILVGPASPPAAHPRRPRIRVVPTAPIPSRRRAPLRDHTEGRRGGNRRRGGETRRRRLVRRLSHGPSPQAVKHRQKGCPAGSR